MWPYCGRHFIGDTGRNLLVSGQAVSSVILDIDMGGGGVCGDKEGVGC